MLSQNKLREILLKYQQDNPRHKIMPTRERNENHNKIYSMYPNDKLIIENIEDGDNNALELVDRQTPIEYFTYKDKDFNYTKPAAPTDYSKLDTFHRAVGPILIIAQCFSLMPVLGVGQPNPRHVRFSFKTLRVMITLLFLVASSTLNLSMMKHLAKIGVNAKNLVGAVFFTCVQSSSILFLSLAPRWPRLIRFWTRTEIIFTRKPYERPQRDLSSRVRRSAVAILSLSAAVVTQYRRVHVCAALQNTTVHFTFEDFAYGNYDYVFELLPYTTFVGAFILVANFFCTFVWNYMDLFIMMIGKGIAYRFEQIKMRINKLLDKEVPEPIFMEIRDHYVKLIELLEYVDEDLSGIILLSCANNLYFVCYQLLNIFNKLRWPINYVYFWFSLLFLIGRTAFVFLTAASINDEAKDALAVLRRVSAKTWCVEVERLIFQMATSTVALSGKKFYFLTRRLLFGMAGTIVTYELVLLQFDEPNRSKGLPELCA